MAAAMALAARPGGKLIFTDIGGGRGQQGMAAAQAALEALEQGGIVRDITATKVELGDGTVVSKLTAERTALPLSGLPTIAAAHPLQGRRVQLYAATDPDGRSNAPSCRLEGASHAVRMVEHPASLTLRGARLQHTAKVNIRHALYRASDKHLVHGRTRECPDNWQTALCEN
jgi:hypothetical protein